jgi:hypothetical protein
MMGEICREDVFAAQDAIKVGVEFPQRANSAFGSAFGHDGDAGVIGGRVSLRRGNSRISRRCTIPAALERGRPG